MAANVGGFNPPSLGWYNRTGTQVKDELSTPAGNEPILSNAGFDPISTVSLSSEICSKLVMYVCIKDGTDREHGLLKHAG